MVSWQRSATSRVRYVDVDRIEIDTEEFAVVEQRAKMEGRQLGMMLAPISKKSKAPARKIKPEQGEGVNDAEVKDE